MGFFSAAKKISPTTISVDLREFSKTKLTTAPYSVKVSKGKTSVSLLAGKKAWPKQYVSKNNKPKSSPLSSGTYIKKISSNRPTNDFLATNPWSSVETLEHFLYYFCPECESKHQEKESFIEHAMKNHPNSVECLKKFKINEEKPFKNPNDFHFLSSSSSIMETNNQVKIKVKKEDSVAYNDIITKPISDTTNEKITEMIPFLKNDIKNEIKTEPVDEMDNDNNEPVAAEDLFTFLATSNETIAVNDNSLEYVDNDISDLTGVCTTFSSNEIKTEPVDEMNNDNEDLFAFLATSNDNIVIPVVEDNALKSDQMLKIQERNNTTQRNHIQVSGISVAKKNKICVIVKPPL